MKLDAITLTNFRCYEDLTVRLHPRLTVLVANNGGGKTTLLDALRIGLWPFVGSFDLARSRFADPANAIALDDVRLLSIEREMARQLPVNVVLTADYGVGQKKWMRYRDSEAAGTHTKEDQETRDLKQFAADLQVRVRDIEQAPVDLPVFGYYGTGRLYNEKRLTKSKTQVSQGEAVSQGIRTFGYLDCLDPASSYKQFEAWFISAFLKVRESQIRQLEMRDAVENIAPDILGPVKVVQNVVDTMLNTTGWHKLEYSETYEKSLVLYHDQQGVLKVNQLSDGIKNMLAMVADIAYRCVLLNSHLGEKAARKSRGVVMIDEVDMHLHPSWQQTILSSLTKAFPCIQFIVTTHSPQVLSTVPAECIRSLKSEMDADSREVRMIVETPTVQTQGVPSTDILAAIQRVDPVPDVPPAHWLSEYKALTQQYQQASDEGTALRQKLDQHFGKEHPVMLECERLIRLMAMKKKLPTKKAG